MSQLLSGASAILSVSGANRSTFQPYPPLLLSAKNPHKCQNCSYCFTFESDPRHLVPYDSSSLTTSLENVVQAAQHGCSFHQWILNLICRNIKGPNPRFPDHAAVGISVKLQKIYETEFIPHDFIQQDGRRLTWDPHKQIQQSLTQPFVRYKYQAAASPYGVTIKAQVKLDEGVSFGGSDSLSFCRSKDHFRLYCPTQVSRQCQHVVC